jgi:hypothetical protein
MCRLCGVPASRRRPREAQLPYLLQPRVGPYVAHIPQRDANGAENRFKRQSESTRRGAARHGAGGLVD